MERLIITYKELKQNLLKSRTSLVNEKIMSMDEFLKKVLFTYDEKAIYYLMKKYNIRYDVAITYLKNMLYLDGSHSLELSKLKEELDNQGLLIYDELFKKSLKGKKIVVYNYPLSKFEKNVLSNYDYEEQTTPIITNKKYSVNTFCSIEEEINFVALEIISLLEQNTDINKIKLMNVQDEYKPYISRIFGFYNIPIEIEYSLYSKKDTINFLKVLKETKNREKALETIKDETVLKQVIKVLNNYYFIDEIDDTFIEILISEFKHINLKLKRYSKKVSQTKHIHEGDIIFHLAFNDAFPTYYKDEDYFSDKVKAELNIDTSSEKNEMLEEQLLKEYSIASKIIFTFSKKTKSGEYKISSLSSKFEYEIASNNNEQYKYSNLYNKIKLATFLDKKMKFNQVDKSLNKLYYHYNDIPYLKYKNDFTGIDKEKMYNYINNKLTLSYSSIDNYYKCPFRFYLNNILKLTPFEETFAIKVGNIFHYVLEKSTKDFDYDKTFNEAINKIEFTKKEQVFLKKLKTDLLFIIETINKQNTYSDFKEELHEKKVFINKDKTISITFMGVIDKVKYTKKDGKTLLAIIDYKTGNPITSINKSVHGLDMQLPIYLYLSHHIKELENVEVVGIYLQKILNNDFLYDPKKTYEKQKQDALKLDGYSIADENLIAMFDHTYQDSEVIQSMKTTKTGFYAYTKLLTKEQIKNLYHLVDNKIDEARDNIIAANFKIEPKIIGKDITCNFCPYLDICHRKNEDFVELSVPNNLDFLEVNYAKLDN